MATRSALIVATGRYDDVRLRQLRAPTHDADALAEVLGDPHIGKFAVDILEDPAEGVLRRRLSQFFSDRRPDDLLLVHLSCHGIKDEDGDLYFAAADTDVEHLDATGVSAEWLRKRMDRCSSRGIVLMLDCCHSGAVARGMLARSSDIAVDAPELLQGRGRVILTASDAVEYAFEGDEISGQGRASVFTSEVVEALRTGAADRDGDGWVSVDELHRHVSDAVRNRTPNMTPQMSALAVEGTLRIAQSPRGPIVEPAPLPADLQETLENPRPGVRESAVYELAKMLTAPHAGRALTAQLTLADIAQHDVPMVAAAARRVLDDVQETARREAEEQARREAHEQAEREAEERARREREVQAARETRARREREAQAARETRARREADEQARRETEQQAEREADEQARRETEQQAQREADQQARRETEQQAQREADEQARRETDLLVGLAASLDAEEQSRGKTKIRRGPTLPPKEHRWIVRGSLGLGVSFVILDAITRSDSGLFALLGSMGFVVAASVAVARLGRRSWRKRRGSSADSPAHEPRPDPEDPAHSS
jgi:hypothetical protein